MDISLSDERILLLHPTLSRDGAHELCWERKAEAFGTVARMTSFINKPRDDEFELGYSEQRYQPFWHVACSASYVYERAATFEIPIEAREVEGVTLLDQRLDVHNGKIQLTGTEHCRQSFREESFVEGLENQGSGALASYLTYEAEAIEADALDEVATEGTIVLPPRARASAVVRDVLIRLIKGVHADRILEDSVTVERVDLYYRPVYAFRVRWLPKNREVVLEVDGLTGAIRTDGSTFQQYVGKVVDREFLFDIGADTVELLVPGGGIALKLARKGIDVARKRAT